MIPFLIKGLWRDRTRSLFPFITVVAGVMLTVLLQTYLGGINSNMSWSSASFSTGHVKVISRALRQGRRAGVERAGVCGCRAAAGRAASADSRARSGRPGFDSPGCSTFPTSKGLTKAQAPIFGFGIDLLSHGRVGPAHPATSKARSCAVVFHRSRGEILISDELARQLDVGPGATATLISSTMYGSMATSNFTIAGTVRLRHPRHGSRTVLADIRDVQSGLEMDDAAGEILGFFPDTLYHRNRSPTRSPRGSTDAGEGRRRVRADDGDDEQPARGHRADRLHRHRDSAASSRSSRSSCPSCCGMRA